MSAAGRRALLPRARVALAIFMALAPVSYAVADESAPAASAITAKIGTPSFDATPSTIATPSVIETTSDEAAVATSPPPAAPLTPEEPVPAPAAGRLIVIDPGHGGRYSNANANGLREKNVNLQIARVLRDELRRRGYRVIMTRTTDRAVRLSDTPTWNYRASSGVWRSAKDGRRGYVRGIPKDDLQARVDIANAAGADLFISVHANGARSRRARGFESFASWRDAPGLTLNSLVQRRAVSATGLRNRGAKRADFYVLRWTNMPAILVETAFISNRSDAWLLKKPWFRKRIAKGIASGVDTWMETNPPQRRYARVSAASPIDFAHAVARQWPRGATSTAVVMRENRWLDAPGAAALAASLGTPLVLASADPPASPAASATDALRFERIVYVGAGEAVHADAIRDLAVSFSVDPANVEVIEASSPGALSGSLAARMSIGPGGQVFVVDSGDPIAGLAVAPVAASLKAPVIVAENGALAPEAANFINANRAGIRRVVLVGPSARLPASLAAGLPVKRHTAATVPSLLSQLNAAYLTTRITASSRPIVADERYGAEFMASAARSGYLTQPLVATRGRVLPTATREWITNRRAAIKGFEIHDARGETPLLMDAMLKKADRF